MLIIVLQDCIRWAICWVGVMATWRRILKRNTQIVLSTWSASNIFTRNSWRSFPPDLWVKFIKVTVDRKSISPCWGTTPSIRLRSSYNLRVTQSYELPISKFRSLGNPPTSHRARKEIVDKGETVNSVSWGWRLVAATLSARPPQKHSKRKKKSVLIIPWKVVIFKEFCQFPVSGHFPY